MGENVFDKVFNGKNFALKNVDWTFDLADGNVAHGLFSALGAEGEIKNLTIEGVIRLTGAAPRVRRSALSPAMPKAKITSCTNKAAICIRGQRRRQHLGMSGRHRRISPERDADAVRQRRRADLRHDRQHGQRLQFGIPSGRYRRLHEDFVADRMHQ